MQQSYESLITRLSDVPATYASIEKVEALANKIQTLAHCTKETTYIPIVKIANAFQFKTYISTRLPNDIAGRLLIGSDIVSQYHSDKVLIVNDTLPIEEKRYLVADALAHYLLDYMGNPIYSDATFCWTYPIPLTVSKSPKINRFVSELLMPKRTFLQEYAKVMDLTGQDTCFAITYLSKIFCVTPSNIEKRIIDLVGSW